MISPPLHPNCRCEVYRVREVACTDVRPPMIPSWLLAVGYVGAAVVANQLVWKYGQPVLLFTAFVFIPFDFMARDALHRRWESERLVWKMCSLVLCGSLVTFLLNPASGYVALASALAFAWASATDGVVFSMLRGRQMIHRMLISNCIGAAVDSIMFPLVAFGVVDYWLSAGQTAVKIAGGFVWSVIFVRLFKR